MKNLRNQKGQALLIILLVMAVGLTIGLAVVSRSIVDLRISRQEEESARVFSVAEAGIEEALKLGDVPAGGVTIGGITATVRRDTLGGENEFAFPGKFEAGEIQTVWLVEHDNNGNLTETGRYTGATVDLYWGNQNQASDQLTTPALEATVIYKEGQFYKIKRGVFDPYNGTDVTRNNNGFEDAERGTYSLDGKTFQFRKTGFTLSSIPYALRLRLLYNKDAQILGVKGSSNFSFPSQGNCYESTATNSESGITRKVRQCQFHKAPPGIFDYVLYSDTDLKKE